MMSSPFFFSLMYFSLSLSLSISYLILSLSPATFQIWSSRVLRLWEQTDASSNCPSSLHEPSDLPLEVGECFAQTFPEGRKRDKERERERERREKRERDFFSSRQTRTHPCMYVKVVCTTHFQYDVLLLFLCEAVPVAIGIGTGVGMSRRHQ